MFSAIIAWIIAETKTYKNILSTGMFFKKHIKVKTSIFQDALRSFSR